MDEILHSLRDSNVFATLDCIPQNLQTLVAAIDIPKTTSRHHFGTYFFRRMPFSLTSAPAGFQRMLNIAPASNQCRIFVIYLDDIIIFSTNIQTRMKDFTNLLTALKEEGLSFGYESVGFLSTKLSTYDVSQKLASPPSIRKFQQHWQELRFLERRNIGKYFWLQQMFSEDS